MGLTIHYQGRIVDKKILPQLIEELEEISKVHGWGYHIFEREFPADDSHSQGFTLSEALTKGTKDMNNGLLYGILFNPPGCEPVSFTFLDNGRMCGPAQLQVWGDSINEAERKYLYMNFIKTQYAGPEIHKMVIGVFRYVAKRYLTDFELTDEAKFWETNDEKLLEENFRKSTALINGFAAALRENTKREGEDIEAYLERMIREFREKNMNDI